MPLMSDRKYKTLIKKNRYCHSKNGFTLVELIITLCIITIILVIATPSFINQLKHWESRQTRKNIENTVRIAKAESLIHHQNVIMCPANKQLICHKEATDLLLVFIDQDKNNLFDSETNKLLLRLSLDLDYGKIHLRASQRNHFKFFGDTGLPRGHFGHIKYCPTDKEAKFTYLVSLNSQGVTRFKPKESYPTDCPS